MSKKTNPNVPHIVLLPSSGMGHLTPFLRLAAALAAHDTRLTLITAHPTVSVSESQALAKFSVAFPQITQQQLLIPTICSSSSSSSLQSDDPFTLHYEAIRQSSHLLSPLLSSLLPPVSAVITDMSLTSVVIPVTKALDIGNYIFFTSSALMLAVYASYHKTAPQIEEEGDFFIVPGLQPLPKSWLPPPLLSQSNNLLKTHFKENGENFVQSNGILANSIKDLEKESLSALNNGLVVDGLPLVMAIGPLSPCSFETGETLTWLDDQPICSVLYISFGSRAAISREQMRELGNGLVQSGYKFLWVIKGNKVDREDQESLNELMGRDVLDKMKQNGLTVKTWVNQERILGHPAIAGFLSHCGWNSVTESIWHGVPILAWPQSADQKINAAIVERIKVGIWDKTWGWGDKLSIGGEEIARKIKELMDNKLLREQARYIRNNARAAVGREGSSKKQLIEFIESLA